MTEGKTGQSVSLIRSQWNLSYFHLNLEENEIKAEARRTLFLENTNVVQRE